MRPSPRQASAGAGRSCDRSDPRAVTRPLSEPSASMTPDTVPPVSRNLSCPSRLMSIGAAPSRPGRPKRVVKRNGSVDSVADPAAESVPVSGSAPSAASMSLKTKSPICSRLSSTRACSPVIQTGGRRLSAPGGGGHGRRRSAPCSVSSRASTRPAISGPSATRSRTALACSTTPSPASSTLRSVAVRKGCGSRWSVMLPSIWTGRPIPAATRLAMLARYRFQSSMPGKIHTIATRTATKAAILSRTMRPARRPRGRIGADEVDTSVERSDTRGSRCGETALPCLL